MEKINTKDKIETYKLMIDTRLNEIFTTKKDYSYIVIDSIRYSLLSGGKRFRPILFLSMINGYGLDESKHIDVASAIEMIHTYSLIHDDLPAMDNDELRRGKPTNHIKYGEDIAILAGDLLLNCAFETLFNYIEQNQSIESIAAAKVIANLSGYNGMISGQVLDCISEGKEISKDELNFIHKNKTSALITAPLISAAILSKVDSEEKNMVKELGYNLGMAFQIRDDILDVNGDSKILGKDTGKDEKAGKNTYPKYYGLEKSEYICKKHVEKAISIIENLSVENKEFFIDIARNLCTRKK